MIELDKDPWLGKIKGNIDELASNISQMFESLHIISKPIKESTENMPLATDHLASITEQTELATNQILDKLESMADRNSDALELISAERAKLSQQKLKGSIEKTFEKIEKTITDDLNDSYEIMESLQFQDITSQRIGFITNLLDDVEQKLGTLLSALGEVTKLKVFEKKEHFDPKAVYSDTKSKQSAIDKIIEGND
ncbi:MAG: protein phosphatase CheZ [Candidatus Marinimicrobia bacterium]|nr:protein phosphatase CheZ [Candidatus Neomarinimicrobiota bacterium]